MQVYQGKSVYEGIAIGKIRVYKKGEQQVKRIPIKDTQGELERFRQAKEETIVRIQELYRKAGEEVGKSNAGIFEIYGVILEDDTYVSDITTLIEKNGYNAEYAVAVIKEKYLQTFAAMEDEYLKARALDIGDISERLLEALQGTNPLPIEEEEPVIVLSEELTPSEALRLDKDKVLAFVTVGGSMYSHTSILAKTMGIPALINVNISVDASLDGKIAIIDGTEGIVYVDPEQEILREWIKKRDEEAEGRSLHLSREEMEQAIEKTGLRICANIGSLRDLESLEETEVSGIGLFRSEFLFFERQEFPTEEEQFQCYRTVLEAMNKKQVVIRTLDIGADKQCEYFPMEKEENPALGMRGIRVSLEYREIFKVQLKALLRASVYGELGILYPMITSVEEVREIKEMLESTKKELRQEGKEYGKAKLGVMIETPAAVMISDLLADEVDFFSIGTNDLTQYTLAMDRQSGKLEKYYQPDHPAIMRMITMVIENAHKKGISVAICGELSGDTMLTEEFIRMGVDELSVAPGMISILQKKLVELSI